VFFVILLNNSGFLERLKKTKLLLPPLSGFTDYAYRQILAEFSPPFICTEMISPHAIIHRNPKVLRSLEKIDGPHLSGVQLIGNEPKAMAEAAEIIESLGYDYVDINMGCTVKTVTNSGAGIALMKSEEIACEIAKNIVNSVNMPVTCKMRLGYNKANLNAVTLGKKLADIGITSITVHGRTGEKKLGLPIDYVKLREVIEKIPIPIIANGNIFNGFDAKNMIDATNAAAIMPGRGIIGNPWLVAEILSVFSNTPIHQPCLLEKKQVSLQHTLNLINFYNEKTAIIKMRKILPEYFKYCQNLISLKKDIQNVNNLIELQNLIDKIEKNGSKIKFKNINT